MDFDFVKLGDLPEVTEIQTGDTVVVIRDGELFRLDASNMGGGAGTYFMELNTENSTYNDGTIYCTADITEMLEAFYAGARIVYKYDNTLVTDSEFESVVAQGSFAVVTAEGMTIGSGVAIGVGYQSIIFTNGYAVS